MSEYLNGDKFTFSLFSRDERYVDLNYNFLMWKCMMYDEGGHTYNFLKYMYKLSYRSSQLARRFMFHC